MASTVQIALDDILVDPALFVRPVDEDHLIRLRDTLTSGDAFLPLLVARPTEEALSDWWGCPQHFKQAARAKWIAQQRQKQWSNLPVRAEVVLLDGVHRYWALRESGATRVECLVADQPVDQPREVVGRALAANLRNPLPLDDFDILRAFERLWLNRPVEAAYERFQPERGAMSMAEVAKLLGRSDGWCYQMQTYSRVRYALSLDLGFGRSRELGRLDQKLWQRFVYEGDHLRLHHLLDNAGLKRPERATVPEMRVRDLARLVDALLAQVEPPPAADDDLTPDADQPAAEPAPPRYVQVELPLDWDEVIARPLEVYRRIRPVVGQMDPEQARDFCVANAPIFVEITAAYKEARRIARAAGYEV